MCLLTAAARTPECGEFHWCISLQGPEPQLSPGAQSVVFCCILQCVGKKFFKFCTKTNMACRHVFWYLKPIICRVPEEVFLERRQFALEKKWMSGQGRILHSNI